MEFSSPSLKISDGQAIGNQIRSSIQKDRFEPTQIVIDDEACDQIGLS
jgi:hypothetical protein